MRHLRTLLVVMMSTVLLAVVLASPASAESRTSVWQVNISVPLIHKTALGTLTTDFDPVSGQGTWSFHGTIGGALAESSGAGTMSGSGSSVTLTMTSIDNWQMPGLRRPPLPASASIKVVGNLAYVSYGRAVGIPVSVSPSISFPPEAGVYTITAPGSGAEQVTTLPVTGGSLPNVPVIGSLSSRVSVIAILASLVATGALAGLLVEHKRAARTA